MFVTSFVSEDIVCKCFYVLSFKEENNCVILMNESIVMYALNFIYLLTCY